ncbi:hypothetical protein AB0I28_06010 [Phytomonospora sp. NPDC050363]|uniref:hypothetical protein n=1 Tax=Phytomonospora sp. NPDC050363 TaxID=3155642 RepID=UPI0033CED170
MSSTPEITPELVAEAAENPGGVVAEIDPAFEGDPDGYIPSEAVRGVWRVDDEGRLTGEFEPNPNAGTPVDDFSRLVSPDSWIGWLGEDPAATVRTSLSEMLSDQVPDAVVEWLKVTDEPRHLTGGRRTDDGDRMVLTRAAIAVPFGLGVRSPDGGFHALSGVFTIAMSGLDEAGPPRSQLWLDLDAGADWAEELLVERIYEVDRRS